MPYRTLSLFAIALLWLTSSVSYGQALKWKEIGTSNYRDFAFTPRVMVFVNDSNNVFRSEDTGKTWQYSGTMKVRCEYRNTVAQGNRLFMSFGYGSYRFGDTSDLGEGVYRSDDDGRTWQRVFKDQILRVITSESMVVAIRLKTEVSYQSDILYSTNAGVSWKNSSYDLLKINPRNNLGYNIFLDKTLFATSTLGLVSITFDATKQPRIDTLLKEYSVSDIVFIQSNIVVRAEKKALPPNKGFAGTYIATSSDKGNSWKFSLMQRPDANMQYYQNWSDSTFTVYDFNHTYFYSNNGHLGMEVYAGSSNNFISDDLGKTWKYYEPIRQPLDKFIHFGYSILYAENGISFLLPSRGLSLIRIDTRNCKPSVIMGSDIREVASWYLDSCQYGNYLQQSFCTKPNERILSLLSKNDTLYANTENGIFRSGNNGFHWERIGYMNNGFLDFSNNLYNYFYNSSNLVLHKSHFFALSLGTFGQAQVPTFRQYEGKYGYRLLRLPQNGSFWKTIVAYPFDTFDSIYAIGSLGNNLVAAKRDSVYYSSTNGDSWQKASAIPQVTVFADNGAYLFAGTVQNGVYISADSGKTWINSRDNPQGNVKTITSRGRVIFALTDKSVWRSLDNGISWIPVNNGLSDNTIQSITTTKDFVIVLDSKGNTFLSSNDGEQWQKASQNLNAIEILHHGNYLFGYATISNYNEYSQIFQSEIPQLKTTPQINITSRVGPNPASTHTLFTFDAESPSRVSLTVYDMFGRTTAILADSDFSAGRHYINWNVNYISSGTYFYRLIVGSQVSSGRVVIVR